MHPARLVRVAAVAGEGVGGVVGVVDEGGELRLLEDEDAEEDPVTGGGHLRKAGVAGVGADGVQGAVGAARVVQIRVKERV